MKEMRQRVHERVRSTACSHFSRLCYLGHVVSVRLGRQFSRLRNREYFSFARGDRACVRQPITSSLASHRYKETPVSSNFPTIEFN